MITDHEILKEFLVESAENLDQLDQEFVALEREPTAVSRLASIFRKVHTIKGTSGFLGLTKLELLTHAGENLLSRLREGQLSLTPEMTSALLAMLDGIRKILSHVEANGAEGDESYDALAADLARLHSGGTAPKNGSVAPPSAPMTPTFIPLSMPAQPTGGAIRMPPPGQPGFDVTPRAMHVLVSAPPAAMDPRPVHVAGPSTFFDPTRANSVSETSIRVDVGLLDKLMNLVGELVLARNQILQFGAHVKDPTLLKTSQRLNLITTELQEGVMKTRMQPIGNIWQKFPRVVRDLALQCGKEVDIELIGETTDLDRTIIEAIKDPLTHLVRNSVDHGIEAPAARRAAGKSAVGHIVLRAFHEGGQVNIEISDDGAGIDPDKVRERAVQRGMITAEKAARMTDRELVNLIFAAGFSTAEHVTNVSGRGVGMDVVKTNVEKIGGTLDLNSRPGEGTSLRIKIPLTLAIIPALIVRSQAERYAIPQISLLELVRLEAAQARTAIELIHGAPVYRLRGNLLPLVYLCVALGRPPRARDDESPVNIVVLQADDRQFGLVVDGVSDTEEIVVKPLGKELSALTAFAGATIMGDGKVALILDVVGIAQRSNVVAGARDRSLFEKAAHAASTTEEKKALLLFRVDDKQRLAMELSTVARLEEFPRSKVERAGQLDVVQYRGEILPLIDLRSVLGCGAEEADGAPLQVVVYTERGRSVGLVVARILDIVEETLNVKRSSSTEGLLGAAVIQGQVTDLLDVHGVIRARVPAFFDDQDAA